jgi:hypothetical protein
MFRGITFMVDGNMCVSVSGDADCCIGPELYDVAEKSVVGVWLSGRRVSQMGCYNACPRGTMTNLTGVIRQLRKEKRRVHGEMERLNAALAALGSVGGLERKSKRSRKPKVRTPMSAAARKKIAAAQRVRWAKWKKNKRTK